MFTPKDIENFNKIYHLVKTNGYTLEGAKKALKSKQTPVESANSVQASTSIDANPSNDSLVQKLEEIKQKLIRLKNEQ